MANWLYNVLAVEGEPAAVACFVETAKAADEQGEPSPLETSNMVGSPQEGRVRYRFDVPRSPLRWLDTISAKHPALDMRIEYVNEYFEFAGRTHLRAGEEISYEQLDPATTGWWLNYTDHQTEAQRDTFDLAAVERAAALMWDLSKRVVLSHPLKTSSSDRLALILEQLGEAARTGRLLRAAEKLDIPAEEALDGHGGPSLLPLLCRALALAAAEALIECARYRQQQETFVGPGARQLEWLEVVHTVRDQDVARYVGPVAIDWILKAAGWAHELHRTLEQLGRKSCAEPLARWFTVGDESSIDAVRLQFELIASECTAALAQHAPEDLDLSELVIPGLQAVGDAAEP